MYVIKIKARYSNDRTGKELLLPALITESGLVISHLRFLASKGAKSLSWHERAVFSLKLLIEFINANKQMFSKASEMLRAFSQALVEGTINPVTLDDPSDLFWSPRRLEDANNLLSLITVYTDWLAEQPGHDKLRLNPFFKATSTEQRLNWCAYYHRHSRVFLNHLMGDEGDKNRLGFVRSIAIMKPQMFDVPSVKRFSENKIQKLLDEGFVRAGSKADYSDHDKIDYKGQAITLLMHYGGVRKSEALHLYINDIILDGKRNEAIVRVYHPQIGNSPDPIFKTRKEFLAKEYQLRPRNEVHKSERLHLGWKAPLLTDKKGFFQVHFFPPSKAREFLLVWANYLKYQRVEPAKGREHPYAFTNRDGQPETIKNFQRLHVNAVRRIGLNHGKYHGTSEHGHRHSYGYRLAAHGFTQVEIQKAMHHKSPDSCLVYTQPSDDELRSRMVGVELND